MDGFPAGVVICDGVKMVRLERGIRFGWRLCQLDRVPRTKLYPVGIPEIFQKLNLFTHDIGPNNLILRAD